MRTAQPNKPQRNPKCILNHLLLTGLCLFGVASASLAASAPSITKITVLPNRQVELQLSLEVGQNYTFEVSTNLVHWMAVGGIENVPTNALSVVDEDTTDRSAARFYRMRVGRFTRFSFGLMHFAEGGQFAGGALTPNVATPVAFDGYSATFDAEGDAPFPSPSQVFFTGPAGSGLTAAPAVIDYAFIEDSYAYYQSPVVTTSSGAPTGIWLVNYRGTNMTVTTDLQPLSKLVLPVPTAVVSGGVLRSVTWVYKDRLTGQVLSTPPAYMQGIQVQIEGLQGRIYEAPYDGDPAVTTHTLTTQIAWSDVRDFSMAYDDLADNHYVIFFRRQ
jgi:hypothetical protein